MRPLALIISFLAIASCYAFKIANIEEVSFQEQQPITEASLKLQETMDARLPIISHATVGQVNRHNMTFAALSNAIFIIGDDPVSKQWLISHAKELHQLHALGFITNIKSTEKLNELQNLSGLPLLPANVDDLMLLLESEHYPLMVNEGVVWQ